MDDFSPMGLAALAELNYLRLEAMDLFERCLAEGRTDALENFIEQQISRDPPRLELLREVAEDLSQRLLGLREYRYDILERAWRMISEEFDMLVEHIGQPEAIETLDFSAIERDNRLSDQLSHEERVLVRKMLDASRETAAQLGSDIVMTERLYRYLLDWVDGLSVVYMQRYWASDRKDESDASVH